MDHDDAHFLKCPVCAEDVHASEVLGDDEWMGCPACETYSPAEDWDD